jgi:hypothetical protein
MLLDICGLVVVTDAMRMAGKIDILRLSSMFYSSRLNYSLTVIKEHCEIPNLTFWQVEELLLRKIYSKCEIGFFNEHSAGSRIAHQTRRGMGKRYQDSNIVYYRGTSHFDAGIYAIFDPMTFKWGLHGIEGWENYYKVIKPRA